jgi:DNA-binding CsgD family transcriptional regulator
MRFEAIRRMWERLRAAGGRVEVLDTDSFTESERAVGRLILPLLNDLETAKRTIEELSSSTKALAVALDLLPVAAIVLDTEFRFVTSNAQARQWFGGIALPAGVLEAARRLMIETPEAKDAVVIQLPDRRKARLVAADVEASPEPSGARVVFIAPEQQLPGTVTPRMLIARLQLTPMQAQVVSRVALGLSNREIARQLALSTETVRKHLAAAYTRTGVNNRAAMVALAYDARFGGSASVSTE